VAGTLSLFDWRPDPPTPVEPEVVETVAVAARVDLVSVTEVVEIAAVEVVEVAAAEVVDVAAVVTIASETLRVLVFDCETTGTDRAQDQVIELCVQHGLAADAAHQTWRIKPSVPIHPGAQAVHGITIEDLDGCPSFADVAEDIARVFAEAEVIVGYNIAFDIDMLQAEYARASKPLLDLQSKKIVDAFRLWQQCEPRSLQHAHRRFVGNAFDAAHSASADVAATGRVLEGMLRAFDLPGDWEAIAVKCDPQRTASWLARASWLGPTRHLRWEGDVVVLGFGKHANTPLHQLASGPDRSFLRWVLERDFPVHVGEVCRAALELSGDEFLAWAHRRFPAPQTDQTGQVGQTVATVATTTTTTTMATTAATKEQAPAHVLAQGSGPSSHASLHAPLAASADQQNQTC
jgi:DNA polymerase III subunit epsilon